MAALAVQRDIQMIQLECQNCDVVHLIPQTLYDARKLHGGYYFCPNGHQWGWAKGTRQREQEDLRAQLEAERQRTQNALARVNEAEASIGTLNYQLKHAGTKLDNHKKRAKNGVCPCCSRTFKQLAAHMKNKHPEYN